MWRTWKANSTTSVCADRYGANSGRRRNLSDRARLSGSGLATATLEHDAALIADEIQSGLGRTGRCFAYQKFGESALPDMVTVAKPLAGGLPLGAIHRQRAIRCGFHAWNSRYDVSVAVPLVCAAALEVLSIVEGTIFSITFGLAVRNSARV